MSADERVSDLETSAREARWPSFLGESAKLEDVFVSVVWVVCVCLIEEDIG